MNDNEIEVQASEWLARLDREPSAEIMGEFQRWKGTDGRHAAA